MQYTTRDKLRTAVVAAVCIVVFVLIFGRRVKKAIMPEVSGHLRDVQGTVPQGTIDAATQTLRHMIADIAAIRHKYPELAEWSVEEPESSFANYGFNYSHNYGAGPGPIGPGNFQDHGCYLGAHVRFNARPQEYSTPPDYWFPNLRVAGVTWVEAGSTSSSGFQTDIQGIFSKRMAELKALDAKAGGPPPAK
jgi:hypothetical protein